MYYKDRLLFIVLPYKINAFAEKKILYILIISFFKELTKIYFKDRFLFIVVTLRKP